MTTITALPTPPSRSDSAANFISKSDAFIAALPSFVTQTNTVASEIETNKNTVNTLANATATNTASVTSLVNSAMTAGLANAATNAADAAASAALAEAAWTAAVAADNGLNPVVRMNPNNIAADMTIPTDYNAYSSGPITIGEDVTVTLNDNSEWSIL
jgi:hypothetical protein